VSDGITEGPCGTASRQQPDQRLPQPGSGSAVERPVRFAVDFALARAAHLQTALGIGCDEAGPPHEVPQRCRAMAPEKPPSQLAQRFVARQAPPVGRALGE
jgi:hypothetical protein